MLSEFMNYEFNLIKIENTKLNMMYILANSIKIYYNLNDFGSH